VDIKQIKHNDPEVQKSLQELYKVAHDPTVGKTERRNQIRILRHTLANMGIHALPFSLNPKKWAKEQP
jgi:hypothetical protein